MQDEHDKTPAPSLFGSGPGRTGRQIAVPALICLVFILASDLLFYGHAVGWTAGAFGLLLLTVLLLWERHVPRSLPQWIAVLATASLFLLCFEQPTIRVLLLGWLGLATVALQSREGASGGAVWLKRWFLFGALGWMQFLADLAGLKASEKAPDDADEEENEGTKGLGAAGCLIPLLLGTLFLALFAIANPIISGWFAGITDWLEGLEERLLSPGRILLWVLVGLWVWALLRFYSGQKASPGAATEPAETAEGTRRGTRLLLRCLVVFNAIFALQTVMDIRYLWAGADLPDGMTYAEYAHRGAYPLVAAALLAAVFVLVAFRRHVRGRAMRWARGLVYLWLAQNVLLVFSAAWRLRLYVGAYSLTRLRTAAAIWMLLVACGLVWILVRIVFRRTGAWLINVNLLTALAILYACCFVNFDGTIARFNVHHSAELGGDGPSLDISYLEHLGPEALPALLHFRDNVEPGRPRENAVKTIVDLRMELHRKVEDPMGWTWRRHRIADHVRDAYPARVRPHTSSTSSSRAEGGLRCASPGG